MSDNWCFLIHFRSHGIVEDFSLKWRNILPFESRRVLGTNEITEAIKAGKTFLPTQLTDLTGLDQAKKLTVVKVTPRYYNGLKGEVLDFMYPYADLEMTAELGNSNTATFFLNCQILGERAP